MSCSRILIVRLPCRKVFPTGPVYLMSLLRRARPDASLGIVDLAVTPARQRQPAIEEAIQAQRRSAGPAMAVLVIV